MKPILYIMCGAPGCGKSTFAQEFLQKLSQSGLDKRICISRDAIRFSILKDDEEYFSREKEVFNTFTNTIATQLKDGVSVIADATHIDMYSRKKLTYAVDQIYADYDIVYITFDTPLETCLKRNDLRIGRMCVPEEIVRHMYNKFRAPRDDEDSRRIGTISVKGDVV